MKIQLFINHYDPGIRELAEEMRKVGIVFSSISTSGCSILRTGVHSSYGVTAVKHTMNILIKERKNG